MLHTPWPRGCLVPSAQHVRFGSSVPRAAHLQKAWPCDENFKAARVQDEHGKSGLVSDECNLVLGRADDARYSWRLDQF